MEAGYASAIIGVLSPVSSHCLYSDATVAKARLDSERDSYKKVRDAHEKTQHTAALALKHYDVMRTRIGTKAREFDPAMKEISASFEKTEERLDNLINAVNTAVQIAQQSGAQGAKLEDLKLNVQRAIASYRSQPDKNYIFALDRLTEAIDNLATLTTQLSVKYIGVNKSLEEATSAVKGQRDQGPKTKN